MEEDDGFIDLFYVIFLKKLLLPNFLFEKRDFLKMGCSTSVFVFWFVDENKDQNLLNSVLIFEKFMKVKVLTKQYECGAL